MSAFGDAFKAARSAGKKSFTFNGKSYHTRTKEDEARPAAKNTAAVSKSAGAKIEARAKTPNLETRVTAKRPAPAKPKVNHMAGIGSAPTRANSAKLKEATVTATRKTASAPKAAGSKVDPGKIASSMLKKGTMPGRRRGR